MVDAGLQLVQGIKLFAGAQVGVELHHRVGAVEVAGKIREIPERMTPRPLPEKRTNANKVL